jgi:uncharacterized RDD family membrane protein YckC
MAAIACLAVLLAPALTAAAADELLLAGQGQGPPALWLVGVHGPVSYIHALNADRWSLVSESQGQATALCPAGSELHVFFAGRGYRILDWDAQRQRWDNRPGTLWRESLGQRVVIAACPGPSGPAGRPATAAFTAATSASSTASSSPGEAPSSTSQASPATFDLCILLAPAPIVPAAPQSQAGSAPASSSVASMPAVGSAPAVGSEDRAPAFLCLSNFQWQELPAPPASLLPPMGRASLALMGEAVYLLTTTADGLPVGWARFAQGQWTMLTLPELGEDRRAGGLIALNADLLIWGTSIVAGGGQKVWFARLDERAGTLGAIRQVRSAGTVQQISPQEPIVLSRQSSASLALAWGSAGKWHAATLGTDGEITSTLSNVIDRSGTSEQLWQWFQYIQFGLTALLVLLLLARKRRETTQPFTLPAAAVPSPWLKRVMAFLVDYLPFWLVGLFLTGYGDIDQTQMRRILDQLWHLQPPELSFLPPVMTSIGLYVAYAILTEKIIGATLGKLALRMRVVAADGRSPSWGQIIIRNLCKPIELLAPLPMCLVFILWPLFNPLRRRAGDIVAGTAVIETSFRAALIGPSVPPQEEEGEESSDSPSQKQNQD